MLPVSNLKRRPNGMIQIFNYLPESKLEKIEPADRDLVQYNLNIGTLQFLSQDYENAIINLSESLQKN